MRQGDRVPLVWKALAKVSMCQPAQGSSLHFEVAQHRVADALHHPCSRVVILVNPVTETHQPEGVLCKIGIL